MPDILRLDEITAADRAIVGGKAFNLGVLAARSFPIPAGFVITTQVYRRLGGGCPADDHAFANVIRDAYDALRGGPVAVRSSAAVEDGPEASFAGMFDSTLNVVGHESLLVAISRCWSSATSSRVVAYCREHGQQANLDMAVLVQRMAPSDVAGVVFTADPNDPTSSHLRIEAADCLGGKLQQIRYDWATATIENEPGPLHLSANEATSLAELSLRIVQFLDQALDIEWSYGNGQFWILQARPITARGAIETEMVHRAEIERIRTFCPIGETHWVRDNLIESLPAPTPMTWALLYRLLSPLGGMGRMAADFGLAVNQLLPDSGVYDLIAGRPYRNLSREMHVVDRALATSPTIDLNANAPPTLRRDRLGIGFLLRLPVILWRLARSSRRMARIARTFPERFRSEIIPSFVRECHAEGLVDYSAISTPELFERLNRWAERTLGEFARESLKPAAFATMAQSRIRAKSFGRKAQPDAPAIDGNFDPAHNLAAALRRLSEAELSEREFLLQFGHRGPYELELSQPRWNEMQPSSTLRSVSRTAPARLASRSSTDRDVRMLAEFAGLRETAKHFLMMGYSHLRRLLLEIDRRFDLHGGVFFLTPGELPRLAAGDDLSSLIAARRRQRRLLTNLYVPSLVSSDDLEAIGRSPPATDSTTLFGVGLSPGVAEGSALVLREPIDSALTHGFILVCPSTDPIWTPYFAKASAVVAETGGVLSHGAIIAREFGLPAIANVANAMVQLKTGQRLRIDGNLGTVTILDEP